MSGIFGGRPKVQQPQAAAAITIQQSAYGTPVYLLYGTNRVYGNLIWYGAFTSTQISTGGGKGGIVGGGGKGGGSGQYEYTASFAIGLCEGPITAIGDVYVSKQVTNLATLNGVLFNGTQGQAEWGYLTSSFPDQARGYTELAYLGFPNFSLGTSSETPQFSFETSGLSIIGSGNQDCSPDQFLIDFLTRAGLPAAYIDTFTNLKNYCAAMGFFISPLLDQQRTAIDWLNEIMATLNSEFVWSNGVLTVVPYADSAVSGNGVTFSPNLNPVYSLDDDDFIRDGDVDPVHYPRTGASDVYNQVPIEYVNRSDQYNVESYQAFDDALVDQYGFRTAPTLRAHHVTDPYIAQQMAQLWMNRQIYTRVKPTFKLPWNYILPDPMDLLEIPTEDGQDTLLVRIVQIEEDEKTGMLDFTCEEMPGAIAGALQFPQMQATRSTPDYNQSPGNINPPIIFETPLAYNQQASVEVVIGASGSNPLWGGCQVWISTDDTTFNYLTEFNGKSRMGVLTSALSSYTPPPNGTNIDTSSILAIDMTESGGLLNNAATEADAVNLNTTCYVDGELIAYGQDSLIGQNAYDLTYLNRGCYGSTIGAHASGSQFLRLDAGVVTWDVDQSYVGTTIYLKFLSFNVWGGAIQSLDEVSPYTYVIQGSALLTPLANPSNLTVSYTDNIAQLNWIPITDIRGPILYQIRKGASFGAAQVVGYTADSKFVGWGTDTYWVSAYYVTPFGVAVYSSSPPSIAVSTGSLQDFLIDSFTENPSWSGTCSGGAVQSGADIVLEGSGDILVDPDIITTPDVILYGGGGVTSSGTYTAPAGHTITTNYIVSAKVMCNWTLSAQNLVGNDVITMTDVLTVDDMLNGASNALVYAQPQIRLSTDGGTTYGAWQNWIPGVYQFNAIEFRINIYTMSSQIQAVLSAFSFEADVPRLVQNWTQAVTTGGASTVTFADQFNVTPIVNGTIVNAQAGDQLVVSSISTSGFTVEVLNSGAPVNRTVNGTGIGY